jgi:hypothetical protein
MIKCNCCGKEISKEEAREVREGYKRTWEMLIERRKKRIEIFNEIRKKEGEKLLKC